MYSDRENRLKSSKTSKDGVEQYHVDYFYDAFNRRVLKQKYRPNNSLAKQTTYIWDGDKMVQERIQTDNGTSSPDTFFRTYVYDPRSFAPLAMIISEPDQSTEPNLYDQFPREVFGEALDNVAATMGDQFPKEWLHLKDSGRFTGKFVIL